MANVNLSKSRYTAYCQCPKNLWLGVYHPEKMDKIDPALQARFESGAHVGELAKQLFPGTVDVSTRIGEALDLKAMIEKTQQCLIDGTEVIAEASFAYEGCYCAVDLLRREGDGWAIYEVKSTTNKDDKKDKPKKFDKYFPDIAYQTWVLRQCGINVTGINLVCLNRDYVRQGELDLQQLFAIINMHEAVENELANVPIQVPAALRVLAQEMEPDIDLSKNCEKPYKCAFWKYCTEQRNLPKDSVFKVYGSKRKGDPPFNISEKLAHYYAGRVSYDDLVDQPLGIIQRLQVERKTHIDRDGIRSFLDCLTYPLYFLDFETMQDVVPQYDGTHPCMQIPFQYSLHVKRSADAAYEHYEFLSPSDGSDPRRSLAEQLCRDIPMNVCTLAYNMSFEQGRIDDLAKMYPDLAEHLRNIRKNIHDLLVPFRNGFYYLPAMGGSFSIKSLLPALFPNEPTLNYHDLDERCQNGGDAMTIFPRIQHMEPEEAAASREALLRYCELDTWAMVKVWEKLKSCVQ